MGSDYHAVHTHTPKHVGVINGKNVQYMCVLLVSFNKHINKIYYKYYLQTNASVHDDEK